MSWDPELARKSRERLIGVAERCKVRALYGEGFAVGWGGWDAVKWVAGASYCLRSDPVAGREMSNVET